MEQHPIPQNVTNFQFRLVGDMTLKQFGYLALGFILAYVAYKLPLPFFFTWPLAAIFALGGIGFAFVPIEERPMDIWVLSFIKNVYSPTVFVWQKTKPAPPPPAGLSGQLASIPGAQVATAVTGQVQSVVNRLFPIPQGANGQSVPASPAEAITASASQSSMVNSQTISHAFPRQLAATPTEVTDQPRPTDNQSPTTINQPPQSALSVATETEGEVLNRIFEKKNQTNAPSYTLSKGMSLDPISDGIISMNPASPQPNSQQTLAPKKSLLSWLFPWLFKTKPYEPNLNTALRNQPNTQPPLPSASPAEPQVDLENEKKIKELEEMVKKLQYELSQKETSQARILELQKELTQANLQRQKMAAQLAQAKPFVSRPFPVSPQPNPISNTAAPANFESPQFNIKPTTPISPQASKTSSTVRAMTPDMASRVGIPKLTTYPNVVTGIVKDNEGNLLVGVLVTVRDKDDIPLRALKTNKLGQFAASTPLQNGTYFVEIEDPRARFVFDRAQITLNNTVLPPLEITARSQREISREKLAKEIFGNNTI